MRELPATRQSRRRDPTLAARIARAELFTGAALEPWPRPDRPASVLRMAVGALVRADGGAWDPLTQTRTAHETMQAVQRADTAGKVLVVKDVPYVHGGGWKQMLDAYLPTGRRGGLPLIVHFHGGGWSSGDRRHEMFGAPAVARSHAAAGCVVVTPSYRLGDIKELMADAQRAVLWAVANAAALGADPDRLFLSGHSAGGNIAALLAVGPALAPPVLPAGAVKGVMGISGVYTLQRPLGGMFSCYKNHVFEKYMRTPVFGDELGTLVRYSPSALVRLRLDGASPFEARVSDVLGKLARQSLSVVTLSPRETKPAAAGWDLCNLPDLPPFLLLNASWDLGLEDDADYFAQVLARTGATPARHSVPNTNHATVTWDERAFGKCRDFIAACEAGREGGESALIH